MEMKTGFRAGLIHLLYALIRRFISLLVPKSHGFPSPAIRRPGEPRRETGWLLLHGRHCAMLLKEIHQKVTNGEAQITGGHGCKDRPGKAGGSKLIQEVTDPSGVHPGEQDNPGKFVRRNGRDFCGRRQGLPERLSEHRLRAEHHPVSGGIDSLQEGNDGVQFLRRIPAQQNGRRPQRGPSIQVDPLEFSLTHNPC